MTRLELGRIGVTVQVRGRDSYLEDAVELEQLGYSTIWLPGGQLATLDPLPRIIRATQAVQVGSAIISADVFGAGAVATTCAEVEPTHPGRFVVGLGGAHVPRPLRTLNSYLDDLDAADPPVPVSARVLAALGPRKLELARERTAGAIPLLVTPEYTAQARAILGRDRALVIQQFVVLDEDPAAARGAARLPIRFLTGIGGYPENFRRMGLSESDVDDLSDRLVDALVAWGDADAVAARVTEHLDAGADQVALTVLPTGAGPDLRQQWRQLAERLIG
jgi:probable F420-dependent oxidoreductase